MNSTFLSYTINYSYSFLEDSNVQNVFAGQKFGFDATNASVTNEEGAEIDSIEVIRDNDKLFMVENNDFVLQ